MLNTIFNYYLMLKENSKHMVLDLENINIYIMQFIISFKYQTFAIF